MCAKTQEIIRLGGLCYIIIFIGKRCLTLSETIAVDFKLILLPLLKSQHFHPVGLMKKDLPIHVNTLSCAQPYFIRICGFKSGVLRSLCCIILQVKTMTNFKIMKITFREFGLYFQITGTYNYWVRKQILLKCSHI